MVGLTPIEAYAIFLSILTLCLHKRLELSLVDFHQDMLVLITLEYRELEEPGESNIGASCHWKLERSRPLWHALFLAKFIKAIVMINCLQIACDKVVGFRKFN